MKRIIMIFGLSIFCVPTFSQVRHFELSCSYGILKNNYDQLSGCYTTTTDLKPEIRIGYEIFNNWIVSLNYGYWNNNVQSWRDYICVCATPLNKRGHYFGVLVNRKTIKRFSCIPFMGYSIHFYKSYWVQYDGCDHCELFEKNIYVGIDFGLRFRYRIYKHAACHVEGQFSYLLDRKDRFPAYFLKMGVSVIK